MFNGSNCDRKSQLSGKLTDPLNSRGMFASWRKGMKLGELLSSKQKSKSESGKN